MSCSEDDRGNCSLESSMEDLEVSSQASSGIVVTSTPVPSLNGLNEKPSRGGGGGGGSDCSSSVSMTESTEIKSEIGSQQQQRISPLRGNSSQDDIIHQTLTVKNGLTSLRDDHYNILARIRDDYENSRNTKREDDDDASKGADDDSVLQDRITNVTTSLERLEVGIEESSVILALSHHFDRLEADRSTLRLEMGRIVDENDWLRDELSDTQRRLMEAEAELAELREEKKQREFMDELKSLNESAANIRPITPSKIPVGRYRVEQEKDINRAMSGGGTDSNRTSRSTSPAPSRLPVGSWRTKLVAYKKVMDKQQEASAAAPANKRKPSAYLKLNSAHHQGHQLKNSNIPALMSRSGSVGSSSSVAGGMHHPHHHHVLPPAGSRIVSR